MLQTVVWRRILRVPWRARSNPSILNIHWKNWCWNWSSNTLATWCKKLTRWKRSWFWERLKAGGERDDRGWDGWMASPTRWTWVWVNSRSWWWTGRPGMLQFMGSQRVGHDWALNWTETELNWTWTETENEKFYFFIFLLLQTRFSLYYRNCIRLKG